MTDANFEKMCWHDNAIHGLKIREGDNGSGELELDIDYILEWLPADKNGCKFMISPATLTFHEVTDLVISIDYVKCTASITPISIGEIRREEKVYTNGYSSFIWEIEINWPKDSFLKFQSIGFTQTLRREPVLSESQYLSVFEREDACT